MPDPLPHRPPSSAGYAKYVQKYSGSVYALSKLLLGQGTEAEEATVKTFAALHESYLQHRLDPLAFPLDAYRECIQQCVRLIQAHKPGCANMPTWENRLVLALRYGLQLPLPEISAILQQSVPTLKAQLRQIREQMAAQESFLLPKSGLTAG
ncbi:sigma-70 family RNA polymerase sigma factor [Paenibacillus sp. HN-1]|uniref:hypothetical protein n=1 Tax=Paenibacillus TaxID=44249 RepID=UPI001CA7C784|nr:MULTISPECIES: hypothetical protein [Paenibacillus]MBY9078635.1 sigma-70 family RNA polymerase sigma factor [Paenibacillus sp. CGMCC 1.18879]MBY9084171.1 sigma-70 family RNA polymerase sigma factor [Paenibacillus sinensis]